MKKNNNDTQRGYVTFIGIKEDILIFILTALTAGVASYLNKTIREKKKFNLYEFLSHVLACITAAWLANNAMKAMGITNESAITVVVGLAGWAGPIAMDFLAYVARLKILTHFGFTKQAEREQYHIPPEPVAPPQYTPQNAPQTPVVQPVAPTHIPQAPAPSMPVPTQPGTPPTTPPAAAVPAQPVADVVAGSSREERLARKQAAMAAQENAGNTLK